MQEGGRTVSPLDFDYSLQKVDRSMQEQLVEMIKETSSSELSKKAAKVIEKLLRLKAIQSKY